ncbi:MAG: NAD-dependent epimerase/dehydratase family protein [Deltaproteobacteria bacterium]|nr:NAD-dependent epimerase/dehydratase family protein [Deltaproteobacteria bacterium]
MELLITGATGFLGRTLAARLVREGHRVRALVRAESDPAARERLRALGAVERVGTVTDEASVRAAMAGVEAVVHCAQVGARAPREVAEAVNLVGAENVLHASRALGVRRLVFRSSESVTRGGVARSYVDEEHPSPPRFTDRSAEALSLADDLVGAAGNDAFSTVVIRPGILWGADDTRWLPAVLRRVLAGRWRWVDGGRSMVPTSHVDSVVDAMVRSLTVEAAAGRTYYVTDDERVTAREFVTRSVAAAGAGKVSAGSLPYWAAYALGWWAELGDDPLACHRAEVSTLGQVAYFNVQRARKELGWTPVASVDEGMRSLAAWATKRGGAEVVARGEVDPALPG